VLDAIPVVIRFRRALLGRSIVRTVIHPRVEATTFTLFSSVFSGHLGSLHLFQKTNVCYSLLTTPEL